MICQQRLSTYENFSDTFYEFTCIHVSMFYHTPKHKPKHKRIFILLPYYHKLIFDRIGFVGIMDVKGVATLIKLTIKPSFKPLKVVVPMVQKWRWFKANLNYASNHLQTYLQTTLQTIYAYVTYQFTLV